MHRLRRTDHGRLEGIFARQLREEDMVSQGQDIVFLQFGANLGGCLVGWQVRMLAGIRGHKLILQVERLAR